MSRKTADLSSFSYVILALVGRGGASPHDIVRMMRRGTIHWTAAESHYYSEPKRLERLGYLTSTVEPGKTTDRRVYSLTPAGVEALRAWLPTPAILPRIQNEAVLHLLAADLLGDDEAIRASLLALRAPLDELASDLEVSRGAEAAVPHRARYLHLINDLHERTVAMYRDWLDEVERELPAPEGGQLALPAQAPRKNSIP
jgi:PadR family transcriptional regulator AphA